MRNSEICRMDIRFADIDVMGHVNNAIYLNYFEQARMDFFKKKIGSEWDWSKNGVILGRNEIDYLLPVLLNDELYTETWCSGIGNKSLEFSYELFINKDQRILKAKGRSILVCFDYHSKKTIPVPDEWRNAIGE